MWGVCGGTWSSGECFDEARTAVWSRSIGTAGGVLGSDEESGEDESSVSREESEASESRRAIETRVGSCWDMRMWGRGRV